MLLDCSDFSVDYTENQDYTDYADFTDLSRVVGDGGPTPDAIAIGDHAALIHLVRVIRAILFLPRNPRQNPKIRRGT